MGLDAYVDGFKVMRIGSYSWYHSFRSAVCEYLEYGVWGAKFPLLMNHSDCDGDYNPKEAKSLLKELERIRKYFAGIDYPAVIYYDQEGKAVGENYKSYDSGIFCGGGDYNFGVQEKGILVVYTPRNDAVNTPDDSFFSDANTKNFLGKKEYKAHFERMERIKNDDWRCYVGGKSTVLKDLPTCAPPECVRIEIARVPILKVFEGMIDTLEALCQASIKTGNPIIFC